MTLPRDRLLAADARPWTNVPDGEDIAAAAAQLAESGSETCEYRVLTGISGTSDQHQIDYAITSGGNVIVRTPGYEAIVRDGKVAGFAVTA